MTAAPKYAVKFTRAGGRAVQTDFAWPQPKGKRPGQWVKVKGKLVMCITGIHAAPKTHLTKWINEEAWLIELRGEIQKGEDKLCAKEGRLVRRLDWDRKSVVLFAADCAESVLDKARPQGRAACENAIRVARAWAKGEATEEECRTAAYAAASYAAYATSAASYASYAASAASAAYAAAYAYAAASAASYAASYASAAYAAMRLSLNRLLAKRLGVKWKELL